MPRLFSLKCPLLRRMVGMALIGPMLTGCFWRGAKEVKYLGPERELNAEYYRDVTHDISYPVLDEPIEHEVSLSGKPRTLRDRPQDADIWDMTLVEALHLALVNNKILRVANDFPSQSRVFNTSSSSRLLSQPDFLASVWDPAIQDTGVLFGGRGTEAALSAFDTTFSSRMIWGRNETIQNNIFFGGGLTPGGTLTAETAQFIAQLSKPMATGGQFALTHNWDYLGNNAPFNLFPTSYSGSVRAEYRQPLLAGAGRRITGITGPQSQSLAGVTGVNQGVLIARINNDVSVADFEDNVTDMLFDTERNYWDLYLAYRRYDAAVAARGSALRTWREVKAKTDIGARGGGAANEAQARETYFARRAAEELILNDIDLKELALRRMCGLPATDGRIIRPADEPVTAEFQPDWHLSLAEALTRRVELRRQKWQIKSLELQLVAARNQTLPRLDFVSSYQVNGFGDKLLSYRDDDGLSAQGLNSAYETLTQGNQTGWGLGAEFTMPIGFRSAWSQVRNIELRLAKAREILSTQEEEISYELSKAFQDLAVNWTNAETNFNRRRAAERQVQAFDAEYKAGTRTLDLLLQAQARQAEAENEYYTSLVEYSKAIAGINYRKGTLLEMNNVQLQEGQWTPEAYQEALNRAWARTYAFENDKIHHEPPAFSSPTPVGDEAFQGLPPAQNQYLPGVQPLPPPAEGDDAELDAPAENGPGLPAAPPEPAPAPAPAGTGAQPAEFTVPDPRDRRF